jgi:hypothetical protein
MVERSSSRRSLKEPAVRASAFPALCSAHSRAAPNTGTSWRLCPSSIPKPAPALPFGKNKTTNRCISLHRKFPRPPLRIDVRKGSAPKVAGFYSATQPQNAAAPWPNISPPHTASSRRTIF